MSPDPNLKRVLHHVSRSEPEVHRVVHADQAEKRGVRDVVVTEIEI